VVEGAKAYTNREKYAASQRWHRYIFFEKDKGGLEDAKENSKIEIRKSAKKQTKQPCVGRERGIGLREHPRQKST